MSPNSQDPWEKPQESSLQGLLSITSMAKVVPALDTSSPTQFLLASLENHRIIKVWENL